MKGIFVALFVLLSMSVYTQDQTVGVFINDSESYNGYTLFSNSRNSYLIDNCGAVVNEWESEYRPGISVYLMENGDLLRAGRISGELNGGGVGGIFERFDWGGNLLWSYEVANDTMQSHHDFEILPNGNFLALVWVSLTGEQAVALGRSYNQTVWVEKIIEIEMIGSDEANVVWEWNLTDHLVQDENSSAANFGSVSDNPGKVNFNYLPPQSGLTEDWIHLNAIDYNPARDQIAVSSRSLSEIWVLDHSTTKEEATTSEGGLSNRGGDILYRYGNPSVYDRGGISDQIFKQQHDVKWILSGPYEGQLTVFNNNFMPNASRVERWTPPWNGTNYELSDDVPFGPTQFEWTYAAPGFYSTRISSAQILPNRNVLICEGGGGHFFEIDEDGQVLWDYINPVSALNGPVSQGENVTSNSTFRALRYSEDYAAFVGRDLTPGMPVELDPVDYGCQINDPNSVEDLGNNIKIELISNLVQDQLVVNCSQENLIARIINIYGQPQSVQVINSGLSSINVSLYSPGIYYMVVGGDGKQVFKFIKI